MREIMNPSDLRHLLEHNGSAPFLLILTTQRCKHSDDLKETLRDLHKHVRGLEVYDLHKHVRGLEVYHFDLGLDPMLGMTFAVEGTPTALLIRRGTVIQRWVGVHRHHHYYDACSALMASTPLEEFDGEDIPAEANWDDRVEEDSVPF